jgi:hypothetical protein
MTALTETALPKTVMVPMANNSSPASLLKSVFKVLSSLKTAIPLLVITIVVTIGGSLLPQPDVFKSWWYLSLLGLNGVSLLFITILHIPMIIQRKGRNAMIGVVVTHLGILILIAGVIYGGMSGFRYEIKAVEGEMSIVPDLPFVIRLDQLVVEEYGQDMAGSMNPAGLRKKQDSHLSLFKSGKQFASFVARPGTPAKIDGITILPTISDIGWCFELIVTSPRAVEKTTPVCPWQPPIFAVGDTPVMAHSLMDTGELNAQIFTMVDEQMTPLGIVSSEQALEINDHTIALGAVKRYTGLFVYNRPHALVLVIGCLAMLFGLMWHFYHRHRDQGKKNKGNKPHV